MDIDAAQKAKAAPDVCCHCGAPGHWVKDCHLQFDIWYMDADKVETALENKLAAKDAVLVETPVKDEPLPPVSVEDFVCCSG
jgi:hypothetical protein